MNWNDLQNGQQLDELIQLSHERPQVIFKHSTRCSVSSIALTRLKKADTLEAADIHYLDLLSFRSLSNQVAEVFHVPHESPQILLIRKGECVYEESHLGITADDLREQLRLS